MNGPVVLLEFMRRALRRRSLRNRRAEMRETVIRVNAVVRAVDDAFAEMARVVAAPRPAGNRLTDRAIREQLTQALEELRRDAAMLERERAEEERQAAEWAGRARVAEADGRSDLATQAELRRREHLEHAAALARTVDSFHTELARGEALLAGDEPVAD